VPAIKKLQKPETKTLLEDFENKLSLEEAGSS
jgi:hypothetical protein